MMAEEGNTDDTIDSKIENAKQTEGAEEDVSFEDDILAVISPIGKFQIRVMIWGILADIPPGLSVMFFIFAAFNPGFSCVSNSTNTTELDFDNVCHQNGTECSQIAFDNRVHSTLISEWELVCHRRPYFLLISTALMVGMAAGASVFSHVSDMYGRKRVIFPLIVLTTISHSLTASVNSWQLMALARFCTGVFVGGAGISNNNIPFEMTNAKWRGIYTQLNGWPIATMTLVLLAYYFPNWRHLALLGGLSGIPVLLGWFIVPESPRWLIQKGRFAEAKSVLQWMARVNQRPDPDFTLLPKLSAKYCSEALSDRRYTCLDLFRTKRMTINICSTCLIWLTCTMSYYVVTMNLKELSGDRYINTTLLASLELLSNILAIIALHWLGRKQFITGYMLVGSCCLCVISVISFFPSDTTTSGIGTAIGFLGRGVIGASWSVLYILPAELFPTLMRNTALGFNYTVGRIGGIVAPYIAYSYHVHPSFPYITLCCLSLMSSIVLMLSVPETRDSYLPEDVPESSCHPCCCRLSSREQEAKDTSLEMKL